MTEVTEETRTFLSKVYRATDAGKLTWKLKSPTSFTVESDGGTIHLSSRDEDDRHPYFLTIRNISGVPVVQLITEEGDLPDGYDNAIAKLYALVKDRALGISSTLDSISKALDLED